MLMMNDQDYEAFVRSPEFRIHAKVTFDEREEKNLGSCSTHALLALREFWRLLVEAPICWITSQCSSIVTSILGVIRGSEAQSRRGVETGLSMFSSIGIWSLRFNIIPIGQPEPPASQSEPRIRVGGSVYTFLLASRRAIVPPV
jgi:hypothetical protein